MKRQIFVTIKTSFTLDETTKYEISVMNQSVRRGEVINSAMVLADQKRGRAGSGLDPSLLVF